MGLSFATQPLWDISQIANSFCLGDGTGEFFYETIPVSHLLYPGTITVDTLVSYAAGSTYFNVNTVSGLAVGMDVVGAQFALNTTIASIISSGAITTSQPSLTYMTSGTVLACQFQPQPMSYINVNTAQASLDTTLTDFQSSINELMVDFPNSSNAVVTVAWYVKDIRASNANIFPLVVNTTWETYPYSWQVHGLTRNSPWPGLTTAVGLMPSTPPNTQIFNYANSVSYNGTPSDASIVRACAYLKSLGFNVTLRPIILPDIPVGNTLPNPYSNFASALGQPSYPDSSQITVSPAPGYQSSPYGTSGATTQIQSFFGNSVISNTLTAINADGTVTTLYNGPPEWSYTRFIYHYANLAAAANQLNPTPIINSFIIGSRLGGLTSVAADSQFFTYPAVTALTNIAQSVKYILGSQVQISYAADWTEWNNTEIVGQPFSGIFNMDPLWTSSGIDFIGLSWYAPMSDWRNETPNVDGEVYPGINQQYLQSNIEGGQYYDWNYASILDMVLQNRNAISDILGQDANWMYRKKDIRNWWNNFHYNRYYATGSNGSVLVESTTGTAWSPQLKSFVFLDVGIPSLQLATNQPDCGYNPWHANLDAPVGLGYGFNLTLSGSGSQVLYPPNNSIVSVVAGSQFFIEGNNINGLTIDMPSPAATGDSVSVYFGTNVSNLLVEAAAGQQFLLPPPNAASLGGALNYVFSSGVWKPQLGNVQSNTSQSYIAVEDFTTPTLPDNSLQNLALRTFLAYWTSYEINPQNTLTGQFMIDPSSIYVYNWDTRPYSYFPQLSAIWQDYLNYPTSFSMNGRSGYDTSNVIYNEIDYSVLLPSNLNTPMWRGFNDTMGATFNPLINYPTSMLAKIRDPAFMEPGTKSSTAAMLGLKVPSEFNANQFDMIIKSLAAYYLTKGNSKTFCDYLAYINDTTFTYQPLYVDSQVFGPSGILFTNALLSPNQLAGYVPSPYYNVLYNAGTFPILNDPDQVSVFSELFTSLAPIYLVLNAFVSSSSGTVSAVWMQTWAREEVISSAPITLTSA